MKRTNVTSTYEPLIVLVHGALTDASVWHGVIQRLQADGHAVLAPHLPMRGLESDARFLAGVLARLELPVVLVAHSYAGAVISHPAVVASARVGALVYVAAFQPDEGEAAGMLNEKFPGSLLTPENLTVDPNPLGGADLTVVEERFGEVYAADVEPSHAAVMAVSQRPIDPAALGETLPGPPAWRSIPSWALISTQDRSLPPAILRFMADRAGSQVVEVDAAHAVPVSQPAAVSDLIAQAARTLTRTGSLPQPTI